MHMTDVERAEVQRMIRRIANRLVSDAAELARLRAENAEMVTALRALASAEYSTRYAVTKAQVGDAMDEELTAYDAARAFLARHGGQ